MRPTRGGMVKGQRPVASRRSPPPRSRPRRRADLDRADRGAQAIGRFLDRFGPRGLDVRLAGLCDAGEEGDFRQGLERAGSALTSRAATWSGWVLRLRRRPRGRADPCAGRRVVGRWSTLKATSVRSAPSRSNRVARTGDRGAASALHGSGGGRKIRYARLLVDALDLSGSAPLNWCSHTSEFSRTAVDSKRTACCVDPRRAGPYWEKRAWFTRQSVTVP